MQEDAPICRHFPPGSQADVFPAGSEVDVVASWYQANIFPLQPEIDVRRGIVYVVQGAREEPALPVYRVAVPGHFNAAVIEPRRYRFPGRNYCRNRLFPQPGRPSSPAHS